MYADFEADIENDNSSICNKTIIIYKQNLLCNGFYIVSELGNVWKSFYYICYFGNDNVDWFVIEIEKIKKNKTAFHFKNTNKYILLTEEDEGEYKNNDKCPICDKKILIDKVRVHCHLIGKCKGPAHNNCNTTVTQKQNLVILLIFHNFSNYDCHMFFKKLVDKKW